MEPPEKTGFPNSDLQLRANTPSVAGAGDVEKESVPLVIEKGAVPLVVEKGRVTILTFEMLRELVQDKSFEI